MSIAPTAIIDPQAHLGSEVKVGPYAIIEAGAQVGDRCEIAPHAVIKPHATLGKDVKVESFAVVGNDPQDFSFDRSLDTRVLVGDGTIIREHATLHRATQPGANTIIGRECYLMVACHVAHDCVLGDHVVIVNDVLLAGHVQIGDYAILGGNATVHQRVRIGESAMVSGVSRAAMDVPPFCITAERNELIGLNLIGLKRRGFSRDAIRDLKCLYRIVFADGTSPAKAAASAQAETPEGERFLAFFDATKRGYISPRREITASESGKV